MMRRLVLVATLTAVTTWAVAQHTTVSAGHLGHLSRPKASTALVGSLTPGRSSDGFRKSHPSRPYSPLLSAFGMFSDSSFPNDSSAAGYPSATQAPNMLLQALSSGGATQDQQQPTAQPLLIELQGGRYVRLTGEKTSLSALAYQTPTAAAPRHKSARVNLDKRSAHEITAPALTPVVLVFRDGHNEEVRDYTIAGGAIYARGDYYSDGYWNKKIELSALALPETVKSNEERGVRFMLPSAPNEVITRP